MSKKSNFKYYPLHGEALDLLRQYENQLIYLSTDHLNLQKEYQEKAKNLINNYHERMRNIWRRMSALAGLDPNVTWGNQEWGVEARYIDDGFGAITFESTPQNPIEASVSSNEAVDVKSNVDEEIPPKHKLN